MTGDERPVELPERVVRVFSEAGVRTVPEVVLTDSGNTYVAVVSGRMFEKLARGREVFNLKPGDPRNVLPEALHDAVGEGQHNRRYTSFSLGAYSLDVYHVKPLMANQGVVEAEDAYTS